jgi:hypothetical protein
MLFVYIYVSWCTTPLSCQMIVVSLNSNTTGVTSGAETDYPSRAPEFTLGYLLCSCNSIWSFLCSLSSTIVFFPFLWTFVLSVLRLTASNDTIILYLFEIYQQHMTIFGKISRKNTQDIFPFWTRNHRSILTVSCALHCSVIGRITHSRHVTCVVTTIKQTVFMSCAINVEHASSIVVILINICRSARVSHSQMLTYNSSVIIFPVVWTNRWRYSRFTIDGKQSTSGSQI